MRSEVDLIKGSKSFGGRDTVNTYDQSRMLSSGMEQNHKGEIIVEIPLDRDNMN